MARVLHEVTPSGAKAIVAYRQRHGAFRSIEQLAMVRGISLQVVVLNADRIVLGSARDQLHAGPPPRQAVVRAKAASVS